MPDEKKPEKKKEPEFDVEELLVIHDTGLNAKGYQWKIRVARWNVDGEKKMPRFEKRSFRKSPKTGRVLNGKTDSSFTLEEMKLVKGKIDQVIEAMEQGSF